MIMSTVAKTVPSSLTLRRCTVAFRRYLQHLHHRSDEDRAYGYFVSRKLSSSSNQHHDEKLAPSSAKEQPRTNTPVVVQPQHRRVWKSSTGGSNDNNPPLPHPPEFWHTRVFNVNDTTSSNHGSRTSTASANIEDSTTTATIINDSPSSSSTTSVDALIRRLASSKPQHDGRLRQNQLGVLHQDPATDMQLLIDNYTVKAVASALRDREDCLQQAAILSADGKIEELQQFLQIFHPKYVLERRQYKSHRSVGAEPYTSSSFNRSGGASATVDPVVGLDQDAARQVLRKALMRMPRTVTTAHSKRAGVCLALCTVQGIPSLVLEKRATHLRVHPDEVCLPGGMVCDIQDTTIANTSIREMREEIGGLDQVPTEVLGVLRLNWGEVQHLVGVAVTPVVCYLGELPEHLTPNPQEVSEVFTIPLADLLDRSYWVYKDGLAPIFVGGPHLIWGLTGYILNRFGKDVLAPLHREDLVDSNDEGPGLETVSGNLVPPPHKEP